LIIYPEKEERFYKENGEEVNLDSKEFLKGF